MSKPSTYDRVRLKRVEERGTLVGRRGLITFSVNAPVQTYEFDIFPSTDSIKCFPYPAQLICFGLTQPT